MPQKSAPILHCHAKISAKHRPHAEKFGGEFPCSIGPRWIRSLRKMGHYVMVNFSKLRSSSNQFGHGDENTLYAEPDVFALGRRHKWLRHVIFTRCGGFHPVQLQYTYNSELRT
jgi:hypothetical protein